ncbi:MAG TPA: GTP cyclohydrolase II [Acetobacteraceae bacterium]
MPSSPLADIQAQLVQPIDGMALRSVDRAIADLRRGEAVIVREGHDAAVLILAAEAATPETLARLRRLAGPPTLLITAPRARALGLDVGTRTATVPVDVAGGLTAERVWQIADPAESAALAGRVFLARDTGTGLEKPAVVLTKLARLLPAALAARLPAVVADPDLLSVAAADVLDYQVHAARSLQHVGEARVPLEGAESTRIVAFRPADGGVEHLAIVIGEPEPGRPVLTRLHSECFTGDLLGSLRCDCGPQIRGAIAEIARQGSGVVLYLAQEGRGIGLINKLRAYRLQDSGFDTIEANEQLGFDADERIYLPATEMLRQLGFTQVRLLTNNPDKLRQLARCGIEVVERVPHVFPSNGHNEAYLRTKAERSGHLF